MRIYEQALETIKKTNALPGDIIVSFNYRRITDCICPTLTTRSDGLKTMILVVGEVDNESDDIYL